MPTLKMVSLFLDIYIQSSIFSTLFNFLCDKINIRKKVPLCGKRNDYWKSTRLCFKLSYDAQPIFVYTTMSRNYKSQDFFNFKTQKIGGIIYV